MTQYSFTEASFQQALARARAAEAAELAAAAAKAKADPWSAFIAAGRVGDHK